MMTNEYQQLGCSTTAQLGVLMLSYVALDQGDSVGMLCFSDHIHHVPTGWRQASDEPLVACGHGQFRV
ncbi:MAG: hypothetical protein R3C56_18260 [Pirellulaceae bacterium]